MSLLLEVKIQRFVSESEDIEGREIFISLT